MIPILIAIGQYGAMVSGASIAYRGIKKITADTRAQPIVAGFGDTLMNVLDPLDLFGTRANKQAEEDQNLQHWKDQASASQQQVKDAQAKAHLPRRDNKAKEKSLQSALERAHKQADEAEKKATRLAQKAHNDVVAANTAAKKRDAMKKANDAEAAKRLSNLSREAATRANQAAHQEQDQLAMALTAMAEQFSQQAGNPQMAVNSINQQQTPEGKSAAASIADAIFRDGSFDASSVLSSLVGEEDSDDVEGAVAGSCCASCSLGGASCGGKKKAHVPDELIDGSINGAGDDDDGSRSFFETFWGSEGASLIAGSESVAGPDSEEAPLFRDWDIAFGGERVKV